MTGNPTTETKGLVFVLMPFAPEYEDVYLHAIKPVVQEMGYECVRADEISEPGDINRHIAEYIVRADFILADLTGNNPNVMYELGVSHAIGQVTIMISQNTDRLPFDINNYRVIPYSGTLAGAKKLQDQLREFIGNVGLARRKMSNPVAEYFASGASAPDGEQLMSPPDCFAALCKTLEAFRDEKADDENVKLLRALPTEMTDRTIGGSFGMSFELIKRYEHIIAEYVERPDLDDETVFGGPPNLLCLEETLSKIKGSYFTHPVSGSSVSQKEVLAVGFHPYFRNYSLFLLGKKKKWQDEVESYGVGFIFFLNRQGIPVNGIRSSDAQVVKILSHLWRVVLDEIKYVSGGVELRRFDAYRITRGNHLKLFRESIADAMVTHFNRKNNMSLSLVVDAGSDRVSFVTDD